MVNQEHFSLLKQGIKRWNLWRMEYPEVRPDLNNISLVGVDLHLAQLNLASLRGADFSYANLSGANLRGADLTNADLSYTNLSEADLTNADLNNVQLTNTVLKRAIVIGTNFSSANLNGTDLSEAQAGFTLFVNNDLRTVKGLDLVHHSKPSSIGIDTIYHSQGHIPAVFLRQAGVPDTFLAYMHALVDDPIDYYTCFISYSSKDDDFARHLYNDLQDAGVRCWFAPENMRIGADLRNIIAESIHSYDKLLLILSKNSIESSWVQQEVEVALKRENQEKRTVLFPIRLDDAVLETASPLMSELRSKQIADFGHWGNKSQYRKAVARLIRDLKVTIAIETKV
jgi:uncharacterized protein YjbI with pentapeptide repeats